MNLIRERTYVTSDSHPEQRLKQAAKTLERIEGSLARIARAMPSAPADYWQVARQRAELTDELVQDSDTDAKPTKTE